MTIDWGEPRRPASTVRTYQRLWNAFVKFCEERSLASLPTLPDTAADFFLFFGKRASATAVGQARAAIALAHASAGHPWDTRHAVIRAAIRAVKRANGVGPRTAKTLFGDKDVRSLIRACDRSTLRGARDRALILFGSLGGLHNGEIVSIDVGHCEFVGDDLRLQVPHITNSRNGRHRIVKRRTVSTYKGLSAARALRRWLDLSGISGGAIFREIGRTGELGPRLKSPAVTYLVKRVARVAGMDASLYGGNSLAKAALADRCHHCGARRRE